MRFLGIAIIRALLAAVYAVIKGLTRVDDRKVVLLGRRMDRVPLDFQLIGAELLRRDPGLRVVVLSKLLKGGDQRETFAFAPVLLRSLYHLATAKLCVLDSYWPAVSMLRHRPELVVYQIWHSLGKIKQSGLQTLGRPQGRDARVARAMRMHHGYHYVVAGAEVWNPQYRASFGVEPERILNIGLPRADALVRDKERIAGRILARYPGLADKPVVVYAPTFRRGKDALGAVELAARIDPERFHLVIKRHDSDTLVMPELPHLECREFTGTELLSVADFLVTDYSSIALEAALIDVPTYYFLYDEEEYLRENGVNIDLQAEMPGCVVHTADELAAALERPYPAATLRRYRDKFLMADPGHSTARLVDHFVAEGGLCIR